MTHNFSSVGFGRPTAMLAKTIRHIKYVFFFSVGIWDTTAMLAKTERPFVMTNAMLAKTDRQAEPSKFLDNLRCDSLDLYVVLNAIIVVGILGVKQICFLVGKIGYCFE